MDRLLVLYHKDCGPGLSDGICLVVCQQLLLYLDAAGRQSEHHFCRQQLPDPAGTLPLGAVDDPVLHSAVPLGWLALDPLDWLMRYLVK